METTRNKFVMTICGAALIVGVAPRVSAAPEPKTPPAGNQGCLVCHRSPLFDAGAFDRSAHHELDCVDCHDGYRAHEGKAAELSADDKALVDRLGAKVSVPAALLSCSGCHADQVDAWKASVHGRWLAERRPVNGPTCLDCHGSPHAIAPEAKSKNVARRTASERCAACHDDAKLASAAGLSRDPAPTYRDSVHGRLMALGSERAPGCADCHGSHDVLSKNDSASPVAGANKRATCEKCHKNATANFAGTFTHRPLSAQPVPHAVHTFFSWLTSLVLTGLFVHVLVDFGSEVRRMVARRRRRRGVAVATEPAHRTVVRFDLHQRIQHWMLIASVLSLVITGWPIRAAAVGPSRGLVSLFGGLAGAALVHRVAAMTMCVAAVYHLVYLTRLLVQRKLLLSTAPSPKDFTDLAANISFLLGLRKDRPRFDRYSYVEKFDYWAVFWGVAIMAGTGAVRWFPVFFSHVLPANLLRAAELAHGEEATLCALALFVWHLYNVHLRPSIFPMNWTWLDGRISLEALREEHPIEYERLQQAEAPQPVEIEARIEPHRERMP